MSSVARRGLRYEGIGEKETQYGRRGSPDGRGRVRRVTALARRPALVLRLGREPGDRARRRRQPPGGGDCPIVPDVHRLPPRRAAAGRGLGTTAAAAP